MGGGLDSFTNIHRAQYFAKDEKGRTLIEKALKYGAAYQNGKNSAQVSMFDMLEGSDVDIPEPKIIDCKEWTAFEKLSREKEVVGIYITGHPLDDYKLEIDNFCDINLDILSNRINDLPNREFSFGGMAVDAMNLESRKGNKYGVLNMQDKEGSLDVRLFGELYLKNMHFLVPGNFLYIKGSVQLKRKAWNPDGKQKEFNVQYIELLENVREKQLKQIYIRFNSNTVTSNTVLELEQLFTKYAGTKTVYIELLDFEELTGVSLISRQSKVNVTNDFLDELKAVDGYEAYSINKSKMNEQLNQLKAIRMRDKLACEAPSVN